MKLLRFGKKGSEKPGVLDDDLNIRDISGLVCDINVKTLANHDWLNRIKQFDLTKLPIVNANERIALPLDTSGKLIFIGFNSHEHAKELGIQVSKDAMPIVFMKPNSCLAAPFDPIIYSKCLTKLDWEAELAIVIGKQGKYIPVEKAHEYIFGYTCCNDLSDRHLQFEFADKQFTKGKCFDGSAILGPYIVTKDKIADSSDLQIKLWVNQELRQDFNTADYIHNDLKIISYLSEFFTLYPGDVISLGSAPGCASFWGGNYLKPNDNVAIEISHIGYQKQVVILEK